MPLFGRQLRFELYHHPHIAGVIADGRVWDWLYDGQAGVLHRLAILQPVPDATIRNNAGNMRVVVQLEPELATKQGHRLSVSVSGVVQAAEAVHMAEGQWGFALSNIDRGTHQIQVSVQDEKGEVLIESAPVTVYLHRTSALLRTAPKSPGAPS